MELPPHALLAAAPETYNSTAAEPDAGNGTASLFSSPTSPLSSSPPSSRQLPPSLASLRAQLHSALVFMLDEEASKQASDFQTFREAFAALFLSDSDLTIGLDYGAYYAQCLPVSCRVRVPASTAAALAVSVAVLGGLKTTLDSASRVLFSVLVTVVAKISGIGKPKGGKGARGMESGAGGQAASDAEATGGPEGGVPTGPRPPPNEPRAEPHLATA